MLNPSPQKRLSAQQALNHPWIQNNTHNIKIDQNVLNRLSQFHVMGKLQSAIMQFIVTQIVGQQDKEDLMKHFQALDKDGDGIISKDELIDALMD